jgi:hypothetical protein
VAPRIDGGILPLAVGIVGWWTQDTCAAGFGTSVMAIHIGRFDSIFHSLVTTLRA